MPSGALLMAFRWFLVAQISELHVLVHGVSRPSRRHGSTPRRFTPTHEPDGLDAPEIMSMFLDTIKESMPVEWREVEPDRPDSHGGNVKSYQYMAPQFVDLNGDGQLDMVMPNHCSRCRFLDIAASVQQWSNDNGTTVDMERVKASGVDPKMFVKTFCGSVWGWDLGLARLPNKSQKATGLTTYEPVLPHHGHVRITDDMWRPMRKAFNAPGGVIGEGKGIADAEGRLWMADAHGFAVADLDGDGKQDVMMTIGADRGIGKSASDRNALLWGDGSEINWRLTGGRDEAQAAGVDSFMGRSRGVTFFDADNDGVLDMYIANVAREDDLIIPSVMLISSGRARNWKAAHGSGRGPTAQYTVKAVLADMDADGHMGELVLALSECPASSTLQPHNNFEPHLDPTPEQAVRQKPDEFCERRAPGSMLVLKLDGVGGVSDFTYQFPSIRNFKLGHISADIDNDGLADLVVLQQKQVLAFLSKGLQPGKMLLDVKPMVVAHLSSDVQPVDFALADFDLDGDLDMFIVGEQPGTSHAFTNVGKENGFFVCDLDMFGAETHPNVEGSNPVAMGASVADMDNDGYPDVFVAYNRASGVLLKNRAVELYSQADLDPPRHISFSLLGNVANRQGIGASAVLYTTPLPNNITRQLRQVSIAQRSVGHDDSRLLFSLGRSAKIEKLVITWPSGYVQTVLPRRLGKAHAGNINDPFVIEEAAAIAFAGRMRGCSESNGSVIESTAIRLALGKYHGKTDPPEIIALRKAVLNSQTGTAKHAGVYLLRSFGKLKQPTLDMLVGMDINGTQRLGGVPHMPPSEHSVGEMNCSNGLTARSHLSARKTDMFRALPVHQLVVNAPDAPHLPPYASQVNRFPRDDFSDPCSSDAPQDVYYQFLDTATCSLTPVFQYSSEQCCKDIQRKRIVAE